MRPAPPLKAVSAPSGRRRKTWALLMVAAVFAVMPQPSPSAAGSHRTTLILRVVVPPRTPSLARVLDVAEREAPGRYTLIVAGRPIEVLIASPVREAPDEIRRIVVRAM